MNQRAPLLTKTAALLVAGALSLNSCSAKEDETHAIYEQVLRYQLKVYDIPPGPCRWPIYLEIGTTDPSDEFMRRFEDIDCHVGKASEWETSQGLRVSATITEWVSRTKVRVMGGTVVEPLLGTIHAYVVEKVNGSWKITEEMRGAS